MAKKQSVRSIVKKTAGVALLSGILLLSTGCMRIYYDIKCNDDDTITATIKKCTSKSYIDKETESDGEKYKPATENGETVEVLEDGQEYYVESEEKQLTSKEISSNPLVTINKDIFYYGMSKGDQDETVKAGYTLQDAISQSIYLKMTVHLSGDVVDTNANVKDDTTGNTVAFDTTFSNADWYAFTAKGKEIIANDTTPPTITIQKKSKYYNQIPAFDFSDNVGIASITINNIPYSTAKAKNGNNVIAATDINGNKTELTFKCDTKKPVIKGVKSSKIYKNKAVIYTKDDNGIASIIIDGKKIKLSKKLIVKKGKYKKYYKCKVTSKGYHFATIKDKAGNFNYISFYVN